MPPVSISMSVSVSVLISISVSIFSIRVEHNIIAAGFLFACFPHLPGDCPWVSGDGRGGTEIGLPGVSGEAACLAACIEKHPEANGITMNKDRTKCYCELNQGSVIASSAYYNRYIFCPTTASPAPTTGPGGRVVLGVSCQTMVTRRPLPLLV
jgi:hypothetical protein